MCLPVRKLVISMTSQEACMNVTIKEFLKVSNAQSVFSTVAAARGNLLQDLSSSQIAYVSFKNFPTTFENYLRYTLLL